MGTGKFSEDQAKRLCNWWHFEVHGYAPGQEDRGRGKRRSISEPFSSEAERYLYIPFVGKERSEDGLPIVYGKATDGQLDLDDQVVDFDWARKALDDWFTAAANIRQMHSPYIQPAGKAVGLEHKDDGSYVTAKVVEPGAAKLVEEGVYTGFSIGIKNPRILRDGTAKNGRIVDGKIVEVSLVDYPANPRCKFLVAKRAGDGVEYVGKALDLAKCAACGCSCAPDHPDPDCDCSCDLCAGARDRVGKDALPDAYRAIETFVWKREFSEEERRRLAREGKALPDGSFPIETEEDLRNAIQAVGRAKDYDRAKAHIMRRARAMGKTDLLPEEWRGGEKATVPDLVRRLHDLVCPAYDLLDVAVAHPEVAKNGVARQFGPDTLRGIYAMLQQELAEDGGTGKEAHDLKCLATAYDDINRFLVSEAIDYAREDILREVLADAHKAFTAQFPELAGLKPGDPPPPSTFRRGYLAEGHARERASGGDKTPSEKPNSPPASRFDRDYLQAGHAADSPANKALPPAGKPARTYYSHASREQVRAHLRNIHDTLCAIDEHVCPVAGLAGGQDAIPLNEHAAPVAREVLPDLVKRSEVEAVVQQAVRDRDDRIGTLESQISQLLAKVAELEKAPDPRAAPYLGQPVREVPRVSLANEASLAQRQAELDEEEALLTALGAQQRTVPGLFDRVQKRLQEIARERERLAQAHLTKVS